MSVFIALIFQVLFVFFAMVVNVGLVVHDKINLQNALDLGAYYGAQRQAEILNEIAHMNYQIRQDYKLLTWRYRVVGTLGRQGVQNPLSNPVRMFPPSRRPAQFPLAELEFNHEIYRYPDGRAEVPSVCITNDLWVEMVRNSDQEENYCWRNYGNPIPTIPSVVVIAPWVPLIGIAQGMTAKAQQITKAAWEDSAVLNWVFTMQIIYAYKMSIATRKSMIAVLKRNLVSPDFTDQSGASLREGVLKTIKKNLTSANLAGFDDASFDFYNGLSHEGCANGEGGPGSGGSTIAEVRTAPLLFYTFMQVSPQQTITRPHTEQSGLDAAQMNAWDPAGMMRLLANGEPVPTDPLHSTLGFEKNPWCMAYVGVKAKTNVRKPFSPFGAALPLQGRAFAQPFGGRVGPWYRARWPRNSDKSEGGERIDPLTSARLLEGGAIDGPDGFARVPNYSRFPGDTLGLKSELAWGAQRHIFNEYRGRPNKLERMSLAYYFSLERIPETGDPLAWDPNGPGNQPSPAVAPLRRAEVAAVTPDLFDATYYSIEPDYFANYSRTPEQRNRFQNLPELFGRKMTPPGDIGSRRDVPSMSAYNVELQIGDSVNPTQGGLDGATLPALFYVIRQWEHLLTGWAPHRAQLYSFPTERFGRCARSAVPELSIPGKCVVGGRTGYSVRVVAREALLPSNSWTIGGEGESPGPIRNPPPADRGF